MEASSKGPAKGEGPGNDGDPARGRIAVGGGRDRRRSGDLPLFRRLLCQLSYPTTHTTTRSGGGGAVLTGFEPAASTLTGWRSLQTDLQDPPPDDAGEGQNIRPPGGGSQPGYGPTPLGSGSARSAPAPVDRGSGPAGARRQPGSHGRPRHDSRAPDRPVVGRAHPVRDSNPCYRRERPASWAAGRTGHDRRTEPQG